MEREKGDSLGDDSTTFLDYKVRIGSKIIIEGGEGNDLFDLTEFDEAGVLFEIDLGSGNDELRWGAGNASGIAGQFNIIEGGAGDDIIQTAAGSDQIFGGSGSDIVLAGDGDDLVFGDEGEIGTESVRGLVETTDGRDLIYGQSGADILIGGGDTDEIDGGNAGIFDWATKIWTAGDETIDPDLLIGGGAVVFFKNETAQKVFGNVRNLAQAGIAETRKSRFRQSSQRHIEW